VEKQQSAATNQHIVELTNEQVNAVAGGAANAFVNFGDIKGESTEKDHKDWVARV
jgi:hypothetical protein